MNDQTSGQQEIRKRRRISHSRGYVVRFWGGMAVIATLLLICGSILSARWIEEEVLAAGNSVLNPQQQAWVHLSVDGRDLIIRGQAPSKEALADVLKKLNTARGPTLFGAHVAPRRVLTTPLPESPPCLDSTSTQPPSKRPAETGDASSGSGSEEKGVTAQPSSEKPVETGDASSGSGSKEKGATVQPPSDKPAETGDAPSGSGSKEKGATTQTDVDHAQLSINATPFLIRYAAPIIHPIGSLTAKATRSIVGQEAQRLAATTLEPPRTNDQLTGSKEQPNTTTELWLPKCPPEWPAQGGTQRAAPGRCQSLHPTQAVSAVRLASNNSEESEMVCVTIAAEREPMMVLVQQKVFANHLSSPRVRLRSARQGDADQATLRTTLPQRPLEGNRQAVTQGDVAPRGSKSVHTIQAVAAVSPSTIHAVTNGERRLPTDASPRNRAANRGQHSPGHLSIEVHAETPGPTNHDLEPSQKRTQPVISALAQRGVASVPRIITETGSGLDTPKHRHHEIPVIGS